MAESTPTGVTRRTVLRAGGATFAGYALAADTVLAQVIKHHNQNAEVVIYPGASHGFFADYRPSYNAAAADAWKRCIAWFDKRLKA